MIFEDRYQAGELLSDKLAQIKLNPHKTIIAGIPRGGIVVASAISQGLGIPLAAVVIKKLGAPFNPELAVGAVASHSDPVLDHWLIRDLKVGAEWLKKEIKRKRKEVASREKFLGISLVDKQFRGKVVIVVDDGLATGQTAKAAAKIIKQLGASKTILAVPCASPSTIDVIRDDFDKIICLEIDPSLFAVGQFYRDFREVSEDEVKEILSQHLTTDN